jgi:protease-4
LRADDGDEADKTADSKPASKKKVTLARVVLKQDLTEGAAGEELFGEKAPRLHEFIGRLDKIAKDSKISGVLLEVREPDLGLGKVDELRAAIGRLRKAGKKVYADVQSASSKDYLVASACDEIFMPPSGSLMITGMQAEVTFFKGLLDNLGVQADFIQIGQFKGAAEPLTRSEMSPEFRKQYEAVIDDYYRQLIKSISTDRHLDATKVKELIDTGLFTADGAKAAGLVDRVCYEDELRDQIKGSFNADEVVVDKEYGKKKVEADLSGVAGVMKLAEMMLGSETTKKSSKGQKIAVIYAVGEIMAGESSAELFGQQALGSDTIVKALRQVEQDKNVKAIVLRVDSPGGSALASDLIWREVVRSKKPVVASMGDVAASGGYYISMGAKKIYAEPGTLTGSIGVVGGKIALRGLLKKVGVTTEVISRGKNSGTMSMMDSFTPGERDAWKRLMTDTYRQFTSKAAEGRKMEVARLEDLAQGRVFTGRMAVENGLVDKLGTLDDAIAEAKTLAGVKADEKIEIEILPEPKGFLEQLLGVSMAEGDVRTIAPQIADALRTTRVLTRLFSQPAVTIMPYRIKFR